MAEKNIPEVTDDRRFFEHGGENYYIGSPTADDIKGADWTYSKVYTRSLTDDILTVAEMQDALTRRGIIGPDYEMRREELEGLLSQRILDLASVSSIEDRQIAAVEVAKGREELFRWNQRATGPMSNTCEQMADDARLEYLTGRMMEDADGSKLWTTYEDFCGEKDQALTLACRFQVMVYLQGMQPDFLENTPEAVAMREVEQELTDLAKEQVRLEVEDAAKVEQEEAEKAAQKEAKKKAAAKKRAAAKKKKAAETKK
jgi:hypothetical protein